MADIKVMISSTARDLPEHRKELLDACLRQGMFPMMMEHLPASDAEAISASIDMVNKANIYLGVFAHRYGYIPTDGNPDQISITEMEYNRAVERGIPRLIFVIDKNHPIKIDDVEQGEAAVKLKTFLERVKTGNIVNFFKSPEDLRAHAINSLSQHRQADITQFHYVSDIPSAPEIYIAHPYTLLQTHNLIGRQEELELLTDWVAKPDSDVYKAHILSIVAIGGMGKSALTWKWFNDIAPEEMKPLAGQMWWSFYESDATFENFIIRALAYVSHRPIEEVLQISAPEQETQLLAVLNREPFLLVLDGLERLLTAYARMDANRLEDTAVGSQKGIRKTADPRVGQFLKNLAQAKKSRILLSTRLHPAELENDGGDPAPGAFLRNLEGLTDQNAVELWRSFGIRGSRDLLLPIFITFGKHPLLIQSLAGEVKRYRKAPGDFAKWREANPKFNPVSLPNLQEAMGHVLEYALRGLNEKAQKVLQTIAVFRMPAQYDTLVAVLTGEEKTCADEPELDVVLTELEDRGLLGWDKRANRYDLHPIVREVVWIGSGEDQLHNIYTNLHAHFETLPMIDDYRKVNSLEDLTPAIELFNTLIGLERFDDAYVVFQKRIYLALHFRLSAGRPRIELVEMLFPEGMDILPPLGSHSSQSSALSAMAQGYKYIGQPGLAVSLERRANILRAEVKDSKNEAVTRSNLSSTLGLVGNLKEAELLAYRSLFLAREVNDRLREAIGLQQLGSLLAARGEIKKAELALRRSLRIAKVLNHRQGEGIDNFHIAKLSVWVGDYTVASSFADLAWELARADGNEGDFIRAARIQGQAALGLHDLPRADERLHYALTRARVLNLIQEELPTIVLLAKLKRRLNQPAEALKFLDDFWEYVVRGPYPLLHADALNVLAQIERDAGNTDKAIEAATKAYELAWCDGPPYAYHWGLIKAQKHLEELGAPLPDMPPFDKSKFETMPEVEINPKDEFHHGTNKQEPDPTSNRKKKASGGRKKPRKK